MKIESHINAIIISKNNTIHKNILNNNALSGYSELAVIKLKECLKQAKENASCKQQKS